MRKLKLLFVTAIIALVGGCSGDNTLIVDPSAPDNTLPGAEIATLTLLTSAAAIGSDGSEIATISALVRDANNNVMAGIPISFSADSGSLTVTQPAVTDTNGSLTAALTPGGDLANRLITVTATVVSTTGTITATVTIAVTGTQVTINGASSLPVGQSSNYLIILNDSAGGAISGASVAVTSALGNTINASPVTTDLIGQGSFTLSADNPGIDILSATALGANSVPLAVTMSADVFSFSAPAPIPVPEIPLNINQSVTVNWQSGGAPVNGLPVNFSTTRGTVVPTVTNAVAGNATVNIIATNAGPAVITATNTDGTTTQLEVEFVATIPATLEIQASPLNLGVSEQSTVTATVRDAAGNFVKNQVIDFSLADITGGTLSVGQASTDSAGQAKTFYTASTGTSAVGGVTVTATVQTAPAITDSVNLTVAERAQFLSIGTGNEISEINSDSQYQVVYVIQVTDALGVGVAGEAVQVSVLTDFYMKGSRTLLPPPLNGWTTTVTAVCLDEDVNRNGILDAGEDFNSSGQLEANNIATVSAANGTLVSDSNGFVLVNVTYPQEYAFYVQVTLQATLEVGGTEFAESAAFTLTGAASDFSNSNNSPPGPTSPFGSGGLAPTCADTL